MSLKDSSFVDVYNYNPFVLSVGDKMLPPCYDYDTPTFDTITVSELSHINSNSPSIRNGLVCFNKDDEDEIYAELKVDKTKILFNEDIEDIILNPTKEKLQKLIEVTDSSVFDRVVTIHQGLISSGAYDISNRVSSVIEARQKEFRKSILSSKIQLVNKDVTPKSDVEDVKAQNAFLQEQLDQMKEMMAQLLANQAANTTVVTKDLEEKPKATRGRKPKSETE